MSLQERIINYFTDSMQVQQDMASYLGEAIEFAALRMVTALLNDNKIMTCGLGPFAINAQLFAATLLHQFEKMRPALPVLSLTADLPTLGLLANTPYFDDVFAKQLKAFGQEGDVLVIFSAGHSVGCLAKLIAAAHSKEITVIALTGTENPDLSLLLHEKDLEIRIPSDVLSQIQAQQIIVSYCLCDLIDNQLFEI